MATTIALNSHSIANAPSKLGSPPDFGTLYSGRALEFDGIADRFQTAGIIQLATNDTYTFSAWIKPDATTMEGIMSIGAVYMSLCVSGGYLEARNYSSIAQLTNTDVHAITAGQWAYVVGVFSGGEVTLYKDGVAHSAVACINESVANQPIYIGYGGTVDYFNGKIANAQVWDAAWSASDVQYAYTHPEKLAYNTPSTSLTSSNLVAWYPMTEGNPRSPQTSVYDGSPKELGSEILGDPTFDDASYWTASGDDGAGETFDVDTTNTGKLTSIECHDGNLLKSAIMTSGNIYKFQITLDSLSADTRIRGNNHTSDIDFSEDAGTLIVGVNTAYFVASGANFELTVDGLSTADATFTATDISLKEVQMGNHGATTFLGDEQISDADNSVFSGTPDWQDDATTANQWAEDSGTYDEAATSGATEGTYFTDNYLKLEQIRILAHSV